MDDKLKELEEKYNSVKNNIEKNVYNTLDEGNLFYKDDEYKTFSKKKVFDLSGENLKSNFKMYTLENDDSECDIFRDDDFLVSNKDKSSVLYKNIYDTDELFDFDTIHDSKRYTSNEGYSEVLKKIEDKYVDIERGYDLDDSGKIPMIEELKSLGKASIESEYKLEKNFNKGDFNDESIDDDFESMYDFSVLDYMDSDDEVLLQDELYDNEEALKEREEIEVDLGKIYSILSENGIDLNKFRILPKKSILDSQDRLDSNVADKFYDMDKIWKTLDEIYKSLKKIEEKLSKI